MDVAGEGRGLDGRRAVVLGLGRFGGGLGALRYLLRHGAEVTVTDLAPEATLAASLEALPPEDRARVTWRLGGHDGVDFGAADLLVVNQAVPPGSPHLAAARAGGARVTTELELFLDASPATLVLVTGTQGKSSTATLVAGLADGAPAHGVERPFRRVHLGGNIGRSLLDVVDELVAEDLCVVEVSSYQLEHLGPAPAGRRGADVLVVTNLLEDHLARHGTLAAYHGAKLRALELLAPGARAILPREVQLTAGDPTTGGAPWSRHDPASTLPGDGAGLGDALPPERVWTHGPAPADLTLGEDAFRYAGQPLAPLDALALPGSFQRENALCALGAGLALGLEPPAMAAALPHVTGPPHRAQELGRFGRGAWRVVDNGVSTTPDSTRSILIELDAPVALVCGGRSKGQDLSDLAAACRGRVARVHAFGEAADELAAALGPAVAATGGAASTHVTVEEAVAAALAAMGPDETLLFSPACSSFDAYNNFQERADAFRACLPPA